MLVGQAVGQGQTVIYHYQDGVRYELRPLAEVAASHNIPEQTVRDWANFGYIIASKIVRDWFVDKSLIKIRD